MDSDFGAPLEEPKKKSNTTLIIVIVVVLLLLCCCCASVGYLGWNYGDQIIQQLGM